MSRGSFLEDHIKKKTLPAPHQKSLTSSLTGLVTTYSFSSDYWTPLVYEGIENTDRL